LCEGPLDSEPQIMRAARKDEGDAMQFGERAGIPCFHGVAQAAFADQVQSFTHQRRDRNAARLHVPKQNGKIKPVVCQQFGQVSTQALEKLQSNTWILLAHGPHQRHGQWNSDGGWQPQRNEAGYRRHTAFHLFASLFELAQHDAAVSIQNFPDLRGYHTFRGAYEQLSAAFGLKVGDLQAQCGLSDPQMVRGLGKAAIRAYPGRKALVP
jgi:hypothetical protein